MGNINRCDSTTTCEDGVELAVTIYQPSEAIKGAVLIGPATGIKRQFYANFANHLAELGFAVMTFDNRGIGGSLHSQIKHSLSSLQCWGQKDMPAMLTQLMTHFPNTTYHLIGHSAGGQLVGLMPNADNLTSMFNVACSSGSLRNMKGVHAIRAQFFMNVFLPLCNAVFGHTKSQWVGMGEPLPKKVARQWQQWCNGQGYVKEAFGKTVHQHYYDELAMPSMWVNAIDDEIAIDENVDDMISVFPRLPTQKLTLTPSEYGLDEIGHMKFFSRKSQMLWGHSTDWLNKHSVDNQ